MTDKPTETTRDAIGRVLDMAEELEASGDASLEGTTLGQARAALHQWVDSMTGVVITPALGRVTVIHEGRESTIASPDLPFAMSAAVADQRVS
jgi:hypothetical protein